MYRYEDQNYHAVNSNAADVNTTAFSDDNEPVTVAASSDDAARSKHNAGASVETYCVAGSTYYPGLIAE